MERLKFILTVCLSALAVLGSTNTFAQSHYVFFALERDRIKEQSFLNASVMEGAQLKYTWRELEPKKDVYNVDLILDDLKFLRSQGKKLFIQLQDVSFSQKDVNVPKYLRTDPEYGGGAELMLEFKDDKEEEPTVEGWVARRWDSNVQKRFAKLLMALGQKLDGKIEGIVLPETSVGFGTHSRWHPKGYTFERYRDGIMANMKAAREAFPNSIVLQYANFMPGEWLPWNNRGYLKSIYSYAAEIGVAIGGPDLLPFRKGQLNHSYPLIRNRPKSQIAGVAVQWGNYEDTNPTTNQRITIEKLLKFAHDNLKLDFIFWCTQEPYYSKELLPYLQQSTHDEN